MSSVYLKQLKDEVEHWKQEAERERQRALNAEARLSMLGEKLRGHLLKLDDALRESGGITPF